MTCRMIVRAGLLDYDAAAARFGRADTGAYVPVPGRQPRRLLAALMASPGAWVPLQALAEASGNTVSPHSQTVRAAMYKARKAVAGLAEIEGCARRGYRIVAPGEARARPKAAVPADVIERAYEAYGRGGLTFATLAPLLGLSAAQVHRRFEALEDRLRLERGFGERRSGRQESACPAWHQRAQALPDRRGGAAPRSCDATGHARDPWRGLPPLQDLRHIRGQLPRIERSGGFDEGRPRRQESALPASPERDEALRARRRDASLQIHPASAGEGL